MWLEFLRVYVRPLQEAVFSGYYHNVSVFGVFKNISFYVHKFMYTFYAASTRTDELRRSLQTH